MRHIIGALLLALAAKITPPETLREIMAKVRLPADDVPTTIAGWVACPDCGEELPIGLTPLRLGTDEDGQQVASADLQMDDVWAHAWTHGTDKGIES